MFPARGRHMRTTYNNNLQQCKHLHNTKRARSIRQMIKTMSIDIRDTTARHPYRIYNNVF